MTLYAFLIISVHKILSFMHFSQKRDIATNGRTDRRTDKPSYRDARTHLKMSRCKQKWTFLKNFFSKKSFCTQLVWGGFGDMGCFSSLWGHKVCKGTPRPNSWHRMIQYEILGLFQKILYFLKDISVPNWFKAVFWDFGCYMPFRDQKVCKLPQFFSIA